ncbi:MAG: hypothetical protein R3293_08710 [Candidatus Promineifilaceae bacterium]|nr:hypothetical protein [Candidatus Promineifilaceae bacterium]
MTIFRFKPNNIYRSSTRQPRLPKQWKQRFSLNIVFIVAAILLLQVACTTTAIPDTGSDVGPRAGLYDSVWPHPRSDSWRTGAASGVGLPADFDPASLIAQSVEMPSTPVWGVVYSDDTIFIYGGSPFLLEHFAYATAADSQLDLSSVSQGQMAEEVASAAAVQPYIAKIDAETMQVAGITEFPRGTSLNYTSSVLIHENGKLYTIGTATLYEVDPQTMEITGSVDLPKYEESPGGTVYNGLLVAPDSGDIITKGLNSADSSLPAKLVAIDSSNLTIRYQSDASIGSARLAIVVQDGTEYVYAADSTRTQRFAIGESGFEVDSAWSEVYRTIGDGTMEAVSMVYMPQQNAVIFANNNTVIYGVTAPLQLFAQSTTNNDSGIFSTYATSVTTLGGSFFSPSADPFNAQMLVANDQINGVTAGWLVEDDGTLTKKWEIDSIKSSGGSAIASDQGHIYFDDRRCDDAGENCELYLVILDITTGSQVAEIKVAGSAPTIGQIFLGEGVAYMIATEPGESNGYITKVSVR